jgi:curved DNA-binding protein CbpA
MIETAMKPFREQTYYELLEVAPGASAEEIRAAYEKANEMYAPDSVAIYSLADPAQAEELLGLIKRAFQTLSDPDLRRGYDRAIGLTSAEPPPPTFRSRGEPVAQAVHSTHPDVPVAYVPETSADRPRPGLKLEQAPQLAQEEAIASAEAALAKVSATTRSTRETKPKPPEISPDAEFNGELLRRVREGKGLSLQQIAERTRITKIHLENVEADRYAALPAHVYLRGILMNLARELGLDPLKVAKGYLDLASRKKA